MSTDWVQQVVATRALTSKTLQFTISQNDSGKDRVATITLAAEGIEEVITINQKKRPTLSVSQDLFDVSSVGGTITFDVKGDAQYTIKTEGSWIQEAYGSSSKTRKYTIAANETYDSRAGKVILTNSETKDQITVTVNQMQKDALIIASSKTVNFNEKGGTYVLKLNTNIEYDLIISDSWVSESATRALSEYQHTLIIDKLPSGTSSRTASIVVQSKDNKHKETIQIVQQPDLALEKSSTSIMIGESEKLKLVGGSSSNVTWKSSNTSVATVDSNGNVKAIKSGEATITVTDQNQKSVTCKVTVKDITGFVYATYNGGSMMINSGLILYGSKLSWYIHNDSPKTITVKSLQLIDGETGAEGNVMPVNATINPNSSTGWNTSIGLAGIHEPTCKMVYEYNGKEYTTSAKYQSFSW